MKGFNHLISSFVMGHFTHIAEITCPYGIMPLNIYLFLDYFSILRIIFQNDLNTIGEPFMDQGKTKSLPCSIHVILKYTPENCKIIWKQIYTYATLQLCVTCYTNITYSLIKWLIGEQCPNFSNTLHDIKFRNLH